MPATRASGFRLGHGSSVATPRSRLRGHGDPRRGARRDAGIGFGDNLAAAQARLVSLGYLPAGRITGRLDDATRQAVMAFQGWESLQRNGILGPATQLQLARAHRPLAAPGSGSRIEIDLSRQVALLVRGGAVVRAIQAGSAPSRP